MCEIIQELIDIAKRTLYESFNEKFLTKHISLVDWFLII